MIFVIMIKNYCVIFIMRDW